MDLSKLAAVFIFATCLISCSSGPTQDQLAQADYGQDISPEACMAIAEQTVSSLLKDPNSAQFRHAQCFKGFWNSVPLMGMDVAFGWIQKGEFNAKNSFGGYVGFKPYQMLIKDNQVVRFCVVTDNGACVPRGR